MMIFPEILLVSTGLLNLISDIVALLVIIVSRRRTPSHFWIMYIFVLNTLLQIFSPVFHELYFKNFYLAFQMRYLFNVIFFLVLSSIISALILIFFMDYFRWLSDHKFACIGVHFSIVVLGTIVDTILFEYGFLIQYIITLGILLLTLVFMLLFLLHGEIACLKQRKINDDESRLRYVLVLTFFCTKFVALIVGVLENLISIEMTGWPTFGFFALAFLQLDPLFFLIILFKVDHGFRGSFVNFFKMCVWRRQGKVQFENLPNDNGQLLNQEV